MELNKKAIRKIFLAAAGCVILYWLLHEEEKVKAVWKFISSMTMPFVVGAALAFVLNVPMRAFENMLKKVPSAKARRVLAMVLTMLAIVLVITGVVMLLIPQLEETLQTLFAQLPIFFGRLERWITEFLEERPEVLAWVKENIGLESLNWSALIEKALDTLGDSLSAILNSAISAVGSLTNGVMNLVISLVFAFYCLSSKEVLARQARRLGYAILPEKICDETVRILRMTNTSFSNFITGQCLEAVILALLFVVAMAIFRMPYIPLICVVICVTALVPLVGAFIGCILGAFLILVNDPMQAVTFVIMFLVIQQFEGNVIYPRVVGSSIGLPGMWVLVAVTVGGGLFGVGGMLLMVPFAAVLYTLLREFTHKRLQDREIDADKLREHPPVLQSHFKLHLENRRKKRREKKEAGKFTKNNTEE